MTDNTNPLNTPWALFAGIACIAAGNGLQATLLGVRGMSEGFSAFALGMVVASYYVGFMLGSLASLKIIARVGHIRTFAALASLASAAALLYIIVLTPQSWMVFRFVTGFCLAGIYVVCESWISQSATSENRSTLLSVYMIVVIGAMGSGQFSINWFNAESFELFIIASILVSMALVPVLMSIVPSPSVQAQSLVIEPFAILKSAPFGTLTCLVSGASNGILVGLMSVYAYEKDISLATTTLLVATLFAGGVALQWPVAKISHYYERRYLIIGLNVAALAGLGALTQTDNAAVSMAAFFIVGGISYVLYSTGLAYTMDRLPEARMPTASSTILIMTSIGGITGPIVASIALQTMGAHGFLYALMIIHAALVAYGVYRVRQRDALDIDAQMGYVAASPASSIIASTGAVEEAADAPYGEYVEEIYTLETDEPSTTS